MSLENATQKTKILVDGNCIVCDHEMRHYLKVAPGVFEAVDIADPRFEAKSFGLTVEAVNRELHVLTKDKVFIGVDAFAQIWSEIPRYRWLAKVIKIPGIYAYARFCYWIFAKYIRPILPKRRRL